jgi:hypothetical protein
VQAAQRVVSEATRAAQRVATKGRGALHQASQTGGRARKRLAVMLRSWLQAARHACVWQRARKGSEGRYCSPAAPAAAAARARAQQPASRRRFVVMAGQGNGGERRAAPPHQHAPPTCSIIASMLSPSSISSCVRGGAPRRARQHQRVREQRAEAHTTAEEAGAHVQRRGGGVDALAVEQEAHVVAREALLAAVGVEDLAPAGSRARVKRRRGAVVKGSR